MQKISQKDLIVRLICDDLINHRLVMGLEKLGLVSEAYFIHAGQTVFELLGIEEKIGDEKEYARYQKLKDRVLRLDLNRDHVKLNRLAEVIYIELCSIHELQRGKRKHEDNV